MFKLNAKCLALAVLCSTGAVAAPVPMELSGNGINWSWTSSNVGDSTGMLLLSADVSGSTLGAGDIRLRSFELKANSNFVISALNPPTATGGTGTWNWIDNANLNANGCSGVGGDTNQFCFTAGNTGSSVTDDANFGLSVFFDLSQGVLPDTLHLKVDWAKYNPEGSWTWQDVWVRNDTVTTTTRVKEDYACPTRAQPNKTCSRFVDQTSTTTVPVYERQKVYTATWDHVGDLISQDFRQTTVPVPGTLGLLGLGLVGLGMVRRRAA